MQQHLDELLIQHCCSVILCFRNSIFVFVHPVLHVLFAQQFRQEAEGCLSNDPII